MRCEICARCAMPYLILAAIQCTSRSYPMAQCLFCSLRKPHKSHQLGADMGMEEMLKHAICSNQFHKEDMLFGTVTPVCIFSLHSIMHVSGHTQLYF